MDRNTENTRIAFLDNTWAGLTQAVFENRILVSVTALYVVVTYGMADAYQLTGGYTLSMYPQSGALALFASVFVLGIIYVFQLALVAREPRPLQRILSQFRTFFSGVEKPVAVVLPLMVISIAGSAYSSFKAMIPGIQPFKYDALFAGMDRAIHLNTDPWVLTHALFGSAAATMVINFVYHLWFFVLWASLLWWLLRLDARVKRMQFFIAFVLSWILIGSLGAVLMSSAGPVYYGEVTGLADPFVPLMDRLREIDAALIAGNSGLRIWALDVQDWLWEIYSTNAHGVGAGISAMPSMHVAMAVLIALSCWGEGRVFRWSSLAFAVFIMVGSVHLGWHYAIDGYLAILVTPVIWKLSGPLARRAVHSTSGSVA